MLSGHDFPEKHRKTNPPIAGARSHSSTPKINAESTPIGDSTSRVFLSAWKTTKRNQQLTLSLEICFGLRFKDCPSIGKMVADLGGPRG